MIKLDIKYDILYRRNKIMKGEDHIRAGNGLQNFKPFLTLV